ncbi:MAG: methylenetetrahydrofolate reductase [Spirochaetota bacterium]
MSKLQESLKQGKFTITGEVGPPKGVNLQHCMEKEVSHIKDRVVAINVTDNQSSVMRISSQSICALLAQQGLEPILQITCRDRNRLAIQSDILGAYVQGIRNILALTGDHNTAGDHPQSMPVFDLDSVSLLTAITSLKQGKDLAGQELEGVPEDIFPGAIVTPGADPLGMQLIKMERKINSGACFFQTQAVYDPGIFEKFMKEASRFNVPVLCGIVIIKSPGMAKYMNKFVPGVVVPDSMIKNLSEVSKEDRPKKSIELMANFIKEIRPMCQGLHIMAMGWERHVPRLLDMCEL